MRYQTVLVEIKDKVAKVILNRPEKKNAMNPQLIMDMTQVLEDLRYDDEVAVLVLTGAGDAFCAGMDLKEFFYELKGKKPAEYDRMYRMLQEWRGRTLRYLSQADDRDGERLLLRRRVLDRRVLRSRDRGRRGARSACRRSTSGCSRAATSRSRSPTCSGRAMRCFTA